MNAIDAARRISIAKALGHMVNAFAMDQADVAIHHGGADAKEVATIVASYIGSTTQASADLASGLHAIMPNDVAELTSTKEFGHDG